VAVKTPAATAMAGAHGSNSNCGGTNNQQSTDSTEMAMITATTMTMGMKWMAVMAEGQ
jgi:hypothetical protein